ncbi:hypothetical protein PROFUN_14475 [Planoprotostelium fungivorum]|uniref:Homeobox domain-containing protein n=1 Tax=Planoprotostelium fungivorum TaxID=1890364 RepID=A0A2P6N006_9EUKA|nr:hypothetical protein PROFUN_14475 [Planoprotostelium fungivorum]
MSRSDPTKLWNLDCVSVSCSKEEGAAPVSHMKREAPRDPIERSMIESFRHGNPPAHNHLHPMYSQGPPNLQPVKTIEPTSLKRKHSRVTQAQAQLLEEAFLLHNIPSKRVCQDLSDRLEMSYRRVQVWFQNKRAKQRRIKAQEEGKTPENTEEVLSSSPTPEEKEEESGSNGGTEKSNCTEERTIEEVKLTKKEVEINPNRKLSVAFLCVVSSCISRICRIFSSYSAFCSVTRCSSWVIFCKASDP